MSQFRAVLGLPVPIWDSLSRKPLGVRNKDTYLEFHTRWMRSFEERRTEYGEAVRELQAPDEGDDAQLSPLYFCVRAHDNHLMHAGM